MFVYWKTQTGRNFYVTEVMTDNLEIAYQVAKISWITELREEYNLTMVEAAKCWRVIVKINQLVPSLSQSPPKGFSPSEEWTEVITMVNTSSMRMFNN